jgi:hypothetical protein
VLLLLLLLLLLFVVGDSDSGGRYTLSPSQEGSLPMVEPQVAGQV